MNRWDRFVEAMFNWWLTLAMIAMTIDLFLGAWYRGVK